MTNAIRTAIFHIQGEVHPELVPELEKQAVYVSPNLQELKVSADRSQLLIRHKYNEDEDIEQKVARFVDALRRDFRPSERKVVAQHASTSGRQYETEVFKKLVDRKWVLDLGQGQVGLSGPALAVANAVDQAVAEIGRTRFKGIERSYPTVIPAHVLVQCGYTSSMPQHLSIVTHMKEDFEAIDRFRTANLEGQEMRIPDPHAFGSPKICLCPALCYHCYPTLENQQLDSSGHVETSVGKIARYESSSMTGLDRLWEFTQRSIIWVGEDDFCEERREWALEAAAQLANEWDIEYTIETANDPFFASVSTAMNMWQRAQDLKFELRANVEPHGDGTPRTVAAASFNLHGPCFGHGFNIKDASGGPAFSGCASWGIERWVLVVFTQHGFDFTNWPSALRSATGL